MSKRHARARRTGAAPLFAALGDPTRLGLVRQLSRGGPASITLLAHRFSLTRQGVTKHLYVLASAGIVAGRRQGREHVWALNPGRLAEARQHLDVIARGWDDSLMRLKRHLET